MMTNHSSWGNTRGAALFTAMGMLVMLSMLGTAFFTYMSIEVTSTKNEVSQVRANQVSQGGIYAAIGELELAISEKGAIKDSFTFNLNTYQYTQKDTVNTFEQKVHVTVTDESGKVNLNKASDDVLKALGLSETVVANIKKEVAQRPLLSVDDLFTKKMGIKSSDFDTLRDDNNFTVYGDGTINLNTASPVVLAAVFALTAEESAALAAKRPFTSWEDTLVKVAKDSWSFNVKTRVPEGANTPEGLSLQSSCYRLFSSVELSVNDSDLVKKVPSQTEAVVSLDAQGKLAIHYWTEASLASVEAPEDTQEVVEEIQDETPVTEPSTEVTDNTNETKEVI